MHSVVGVSLLDRIESSTTAEGFRLQARSSTNLHWADAALVRQVAGGFHNMMTSVPAWPIRCDLLRFRFRVLQPEGLVQGTACAEQDLLFVS